MEVRVLLTAESAMAACEGVEQLEFGHRMSSTSLQSSWELLFRNPQVELAPAGLKTPGLRLGG